MVCLDTNFLIGIIRHDNDTKKKLISLRKSQATIFTTIINIAELYFGAYNSKYKSQGLSDVLAIKNSIQLLFFDEEAAEKYGMLASDPIIRSNKVNAEDLFIASIVLANNEEFITRDNDFSRIPNIKLSSW